MQRSTCSVPTQQQPGVNLATSVVSTPSDILVTGGHLTHSWTGLFTLGHHVCLNLAASCTCFVDEVFQVLHLRLAQLPSLSTHEGLAHHASLITHACPTTDPCPTTGSHRHPLTRRSCDPSPSSHFLSPPLPNCGGIHQHTPDTGM
jgi:hypothetical protein